MGDNVVLCPTCGRPLDLNTYSSLMVLSEDHGLFTMKCNFCNEEFSSVERILCLCASRLKALRIRLMLEWEKTSI